MLTKIKMSNFKLFDDEVIIPLSNLNIFTGINGRGKSTAQQSLILMKQSIENNEIKHIKFHGSYLELGSFNDIKNKDAQIEFSFYRDDKNYLSYKFGAELADQLVSDRITYDSFGSFNIDFTKVKYIAAERLSPKAYYKREIGMNSNGVGKNGEFTVSILLDKSEDYDLINSNLLLPTDKTTTLPDQTGEWLNRIFQGAAVDVRKLSTTLLEMTFMGPNSKTKKDIKAPNMGYGYSNVLPIVVAGLIAREGDMLIIDSPEAHLHPSAQSELAKFLAKVSLCGIQVFIETHSEHILNGIRIAVNSDDINISSDNVSLLYFQDNAVERIKQITIESNGSINEWPNGFFDQYEKDLSKLYGI